MLMPKRVKRRKQFRGSMAGKALRGNKITKGNLCVARRNASRAVSSGTPEISNITRPGFTTATQSYRCCCK